MARAIFTRLALLIVGTGLFSWVRAVDENEGLGQTYHDSSIHSFVPSFSVGYSYQLPEQYKTNLQGGNDKSLSPELLRQDSWSKRPMGNADHQDPSWVSMRSENDNEASKEQQIIALTGSDYDELYGELEPFRAAKAGSLAYILHHPKVLGELPSSMSSQTTGSVDSLGNVPTDRRGYLSPSKTISKNLNHLRGRFAQRAAQRRESRLIHGENSPDVGDKWVSTNPHEGVHTLGSKKTDVTNRHETLEDIHRPERQYLPVFLHYDSNTGGFTTERDEPEIPEEGLLQKLVDALTTRDESTLVSLLLHRNDNAFFRTLRIAMTNVLDPGLGPKKWPSELIQLILRYTGKANISPYRTPLIHVAATLGDARVLQLLLDHGVPVDKTYSSQTPLQRAVKKGNLGAAQLLVQHGADVDRPVSTNSPTTLADLASARYEWDLRQMHVTLEESTEMTNKPGFVWVSEDGGE